MKKSAIESLKKKILRVLEENPKARDSDQWLTLKIWALYYPSKIKTIEEEVNGVVRPRKYVCLEDILDLPREDNVKRIRAKIQNEEHRFMPTTLEVAKQRKISEEDWNHWSLNL